MKQTSLTSQILDAIPAGNYAFCALLKLMDIVETETVATAAVECRKSPRFLINPVFVKKHANTTEKLLMLVLHELNHVLLGHTTLFPHVTDADNLVFDAVINSMLCRLFPDKAHTALFTDFYSTELFPQCLLRPPKGWPNRPQCPEGLKTLPKELSQQAWRVMKDLYSYEGATYDSVMALLKRLKVNAEGTELIGSHGKEFNPISNWESVNSEVFEAIRRIVEDWDMPPDPLKGRSWNDVMNEYFLRARKNLAQKKALVKLIRLVGRESKSYESRERAKTPIETLSAIAASDRRHAVQRLCGFESLLYRDTAIIKGRSDTTVKVHLYIDVSGSMDHYIEAIYGAALLCREHLEPHVHLFSTQVHDITFGQLKGGVCKSTYGTDISCVAEHMRNHHIKNAVLVTDGYVGRPGTTDEKALTEVKLGVAYTALSSKTDLGRFANFSIDLE